MKLYTYKGFTITRSGGPDAPWIARRWDGAKFRADTLQGVKSLVTGFLKSKGE